MLNNKLKTNRGNYQRNLSEVCYYKENYEYRDICTC